MNLFRQIENDLIVLPLASNVSRKVAKLVENALIQAYGPENCVNKNAGTSVYGINTEFLSRLAHNVVTRAVMDVYDTQLLVHRNNLAVRAAAFAAACQTLDADGNRIPTMFSPEYANRDFSSDRPAYSGARRGLMELDP